MLDWLITNHLEYWKFKDKRINLPLAGQWLLAKLMKYNTKVLYKPAVMKLYEYVIKSSYAAWLSVNSNMLLDRQSLCINVYCGENTTCVTYV